MRNYNLHQLKDKHNLIKELSTVADLLKVAREHGDLEEVEELIEWKKRIMKGLRVADGRKRKLEEESDKLMYSRPQKQIEAYYYNQVEDFNQPIEIVLEKEDFSELGEDTPSRATRTL